ncbi:gamma carbonic anhydrase family protein, partial [Klebsiella pneumoniae]
MHALLNFHRVQGLHTEIKATKLFLCSRIFEVYIAAQLRTYKA